MVSEAEKFVQSVAAAEGAEAGTGTSVDAASLQGQLEAAEARAAELQASIDAMYSTLFEGLELPENVLEGAEEGSVQLPALRGMTEASFGELGRAAPKVPSPTGPAGATHARMCALTQPRAGVACARTLPGTAVHSARLAALAAADVQQRGARRPDAPPAHPAPPCSCWPTFFGPRKKATPRAGCNSRLRCVD